MLRKVLLTSVTAAVFSAFAPAAAALDIFFNYDNNSGSVASVAKLSLTSDGSKTTFSLLATQTGTGTIGDIFWGCTVGCSSSDFQGPSFAFFPNAGNASYTFDMSASWTPAIGSGATAVWTGDDSDLTHYLKATTPNSASKPVSYAMLFISGGAKSGYYLAPIDDQPFPFPPAAVPEPGTYAMLLAGLGVLVFVARKRMRS